MATPKSIELFWFPTAVAPGLGARLHPLLPAHEHARAARLRDPEARLRFIASHAALRRLLAQRLGGAPARLPIAEQGGGKPYLPGAEMEFNLSHSGEFALIGMGSVPLGVDIERDRPRLDALGIARRFFTPRELDWIAAHDSGARPHAFARLWSCKEAWLKLTGKGLALPLDAVEVSFGARGTRIAAARATRAGAANADALASEWFVSELELAPGYAAALVTGQPHAAPRPELLDLRKVPSGP